MVDPLCGDCIRIAWHHTPRRPFEPADPEGVPGANPMASPYCEGAESMAGLGLPQFQGFIGVLGSYPENVTKTTSKFSLEGDKTGSRWGGQGNLMSACLGGR